ncbi:MAG: DUF5666 domain-containing protein [Candidatus Electrothrix aestuarii]|uniref:DUF5666 domain-containing protein n=1 Tax=Candidatus Electrothrix aestuarii TaxID=3062594 RepID=A0AAU8LSN9_9BACT|nr:DUF5666 domain-containing protein [Candidatus Electrothrix aestuarii]WPD21432.1 MAG: DUF5666 domain-containing protein [Candidatus Electrothrix sp. GW3-3]
MNKQMIKQPVARNFRKNIVLFSALLLSCAVCTGPVFASGNERHERNERYEYERGERYRGESKLYGVIEKMPESGYNGIWLIDGKQIRVTDSTRIKEKYGRAAIGKYVEVEGLRDGESLKAYEIEVERSRAERFDDRRGNSKFYGKVETLPEKGLNGLWKIDGREVIVTPNTMINEEYGKLAVGSLVDVEGRRTEKGLVAHEIEVKKVK